MKIKVKSSQSKTLPQSQQRRALLAQEGFITKFIRVIIDDFNYKFRYEKHEKREKYEQFCKLAKGER